MNAKNTKQEAKNETTNLVTLHRINADIKAFEKSFGTAKVYCDAISGVCVSGMHTVPHAIGAETPEKAREIYKEIRKGTQDYDSAIQYAESVQYRVSKLIKEFVEEFNKPMATAPAVENPVKDAVEKAVAESKFLMKKAKVTISKPASDKAVKVTK